ncbi:MAG TPA: hypothetical protein VHW23_44910 [Kofleriaceae bacterium]|nr:hypothetical protein [Kofleriaceae bacterium]
MLVRTTRTPSTTRSSYMESVSAQTERTRAPVWHWSALGPPDSLDASGRARWYVRIVATAAVVAASAWSLILLASQLHGVLRSSSPVVGLQLTTTVGLICLCGASWLLPSPVRGRRSLGLVLVVVGAAIGVTTLLEHVTGVELGPPGRMGGNTALLFVCLGAGLALGLGRSPRTRAVSDALVLSAAAICLSALISLAFGSQS